MSDVSPQPPPSTPGDFSSDFSLYEVVCSGRFESVVIMHVGLWVPTVPLSDFGIRIILASQNVLESGPFLLVFRRV